MRFTIKSDRIAAKRGSRSRRRLFHLAELNATPDFTSGSHGTEVRRAILLGQNTRSSLGTEGATFSRERPKEFYCAHRSAQPQGVARAEAGNICALRRSYGVQFRRNQESAQR